VASSRAEIAAHYDVDGIHLDYIRQPDLETGYDRTPRALRAGPRRRSRAPGRLPSPQRTEVWRAWRQFQRDQVTAVVRRVRDTLRAVRPRSC
jgi:uncharacterized lipoprotein YddW (UPF0748 family)